VRVEANGGGARVVLVDDHPMFRSGMRIALETGTDLTVVAEADSADAAVRAVTAAQPDVVVMDLHLPDRSGVDATRSLLAVQPDLAILIMTMSEDDDAIVAALNAGARGYLLKSSGRDEVLHAIRAVAHGGSVFSAGIAARLAALVNRRPAVPRLRFPMLSDREREVLELVARGYDNRRIARELFLSDKTVRNHVSNLTRKLGVSDRVSAIVLAREAGLGSPEPDPVG
jgi:DNA-binding NarL/FixJ family response regulator